MIYVLSAQVNETACISKSNTATEHIETFEKSFKKFFFSVSSVAKGLLQDVMFSGYFLRLILFPVFILVQVLLDQYETGAQHRDIVHLTDNRQHIGHKIEGIEHID